jgi:hypothetical protein
MICQLFTGKYYAVYVYPSQYWSTAGWVSDPFKATTMKKSLAVNMAKELHARTTIIFK